MYILYLRRLGLFFFFFQVVRAYLRLSQPVIGNLQHVSSVVLYLLSILFFRSTNPATLSCPPYGNEMFISIHRSGKIALLASTGWFDTCFLKIPKILNAVAVKITWSLKFEETILRVRRPYDDSYSSILVIICSRTSPRMVPSICLHSWIWTFLWFSEQQHTRRSKRNRHRNLNGEIWKIWKFKFDENTKKRRVKYIQVEKFNGREM